MRVFWLITLLFLLTGCSGNRIVCHSLSELSPDNYSEFSGSCDIAPGDDVLVKLTDGKTVAGTIKVLSSSRLVLENPDDESPPRMILADEILSIESKQVDTPKTLLGFGVIAVMIGVVAYSVANMSMRFGS